jgi:UDP-N-acetylmuramoyl-tripeptide--D-alanyl-D-alanine ligase
MKELGSKEDEMHKKLGASLDKMGFSNAAFVGDKGIYYSEEFEGKKLTFSNAEEFKQNFKAWDEYNYYFIKGSRSLQLESILDITYH